MPPIAVSLLVLLGAVAAALLGFGLRPRLGPSASDKETREGVRIAMGLMTTFTAIVLGMVTASAKDTYDQAAAVVTGMSVDFVTLDRKLDNYGPEAAGVRETLKSCLARMTDRLRMGEMYFEGNKRAVEVGTSVENLWSAIHALTPSNARQEDLRDQALAILSGRVKFGPGNIEQQRWAFAVKPASVPEIFLFVVVAWLLLEFFALGLFCPRDTAVVVAVGLAAVVVSSSMFLILELEDPVTGLMRVPLESLELAQELIGR